MSDTEPKMCDRCGENPARFTVEGDAEDGSQDERLCGDCVRDT